MDLLSLCLRIPNLGILIFYLIFVIIIPYILMASNSNEMLKYYMPLLVAFANLLTLAGDKRVFGNLYQLQPNNFIAFISSNFINLFALFGILWQCLEHSRRYDIDVTRSVIYGTILFIIAFPMARQGLAFILTNVDAYLKNTTDLKYNYNWHLMAFGLLYIVFLLGLQAILLSLVDFSKDDTKNTKNNTRSINNILNNLSRKTPSKAPKKAGIVKPAPAPVKPAPAPAPVRVAPAPAPARVAPVRVTPAPAPVRVAPAESRTKQIMDKISLTNIRNVIKSTSKKISSSSSSSTSKVSSTTR
jgi:hypothetical protein